MSRLVIAAMLFFSLSTIAVVQADSFESPTEQFLEFNSIEEIQYNLRLDDVTLAYSDLFQKAASYENEGFIAYHGDSLDYRIYQDAIRLTLQEVIGIQIPQDFHFLDIPCFGDEILGELEDIMHFFGPDKNEGYKVQQQLFATHPAVYGNHSQHGHTAVKHFSNNLPVTKPEVLIHRLEDFFDHLGMEPDVANAIFETGRSLLKDDRGILLQLFDVSEQPYAFADQNGYPAYPNGYPYANRRLSDLYYGDQAEAPKEIKLLLCSAGTLNPNSPLRIKRYDKLQPSMVRSYESAIQDLIKNTPSDANRVASYQDDLARAWEDKE